MELAGSLLFGNINFVSDYKPEENRQSGGSPPTFGEHSAVLTVLDF